jgi:hypothetical protein
MCLLEVHILFSELLIVRYEIILKYLNKNRNFLVDSFFLSTFARQKSNKYLL